MPWVPTPITKVTLGFQTMSWKTVPSSPAVLIPFFDELELSFIDQNMNPLATHPVGVPYTDPVFGDHTFSPNGNYAADPAWEAPFGTTEDVYGITVHHRNPGFDLPFWFSLYQCTAVAPAYPGGNIGFFDINCTDPTPETYNVVGDRWLGSDNTVTLEPAPNIGFRVLEGFLTDTQSATGMGPSWVGRTYPQITGGPLPVDADWLVSLEGAPGSYAMHRIEHMPWYGSGYTPLAPEPPLGDITVMWFEFVESASAGEPNVQAFFR